MYFSLSWFDIFPLQQKNKKKKIKMEEKKKKKKTKNKTKPFPEIHWSVQQFFAS